MNNARVKYLIFDWPQKIDQWQYSKENEKA